MASEFFSYGAEEKEYLCRKDKKLGDMIQRIGDIRRPVIPDLFSALVNAILCQQVSSKAGETVWQRLLQQCPPPLAQSLAAASLEEIQACGTTFKKAEYIQTLAREVVEGRLDLQALSLLPDEEVIARLVQLPGIGRWTAEMMLIFSMQRPDVVSYGDLAILRGMRMVYRHRKITPQLFEKYRKRYSPWGSVASLYLWAVSHGGMGITDPAAPHRKPPDNPNVGVVSK